MMDSEARRTFGRESKWLTEYEAAEYLGNIGVRTLRRWREEKRLGKKSHDSPPPYYRKGCHVWYNCDDLDKWLQNGAIDFQ